MEPIKNILVALDTTEMNETIMAYATFMVNTSKAEKIYFVNIIKNLSIPDEVKKEFPNMEKNALEERENFLKDVIKKSFQVTREIQVEYIVKPGRPSKSILSLVKKHGIDVILAGRKHTIPGTGILVPRLARLASCSLLVVPEGSTPGIDKLLVPIDFSKYSKIALKQAINIAKFNKRKTEIVCQNVFTVPVGYHYTGKSYEEFAEVMKKNAMKEFKRFIKDVDSEGIPITEVYSQDINENIASDICDLAKQIKPDAILFGAKGLTATTAIFIGSLAEKLVNMGLEFPIFVTRARGKSSGIIDHIKEM